MVVDNEKAKAVKEQKADPASQTKAETNTPEPQPNAKPDTKGAEAQGKAEPELFTIEILAEKYRIPTWQIAALNRLMTWGEGKLVTDDAYKAALKRLSNRPIGG